MPVYKFDALKKEYVTPKHSTAFGSLVTGEQIEVGLLRFKAGEGANEHAHPHEQVLMVLSGRVRMRIAGETGVVYAPFADEWQLSSDMDVNYLMSARPQ